MDSGRSIEYEALINKASAMLDKEQPNVTAIKKINEELVAALSPKDEFLFRWRYICKQKGWLE